MRQSLPTSTQWQIETAAWILGRLSSKLRNVAINANERPCGLAHGNWWAARACCADRWAVDTGSQRNVAVASPAPLSGGLRGVAAILSASVASLPTGAVPRGAAAAAILRSASRAHGPGRAAERRRAHTPSVALPVTRPSVPLPAATGQCEPRPGRIRRRRGMYETVSKHLLSDKHDFDW